MDKLNQPLPEINGNSGPLIGGFENPKVASVQVQQQPEPQVRQASSAFPGHFQTQTPGRQQQVTSNQFFNRAAKPAAVAEPVAAPEARVAEVPESVSSLPDGITTGNSSYAPGSVRSLEKKLW